MKCFLSVTVITLAALTAVRYGHALPNYARTLNAASVASNQVAVTILNAKFEGSDNLVFAPFGYSTILAMLGEGATGETRQEIRSFLRQPTDDESTARSVYRDILTRFNGDDPTHAPQFKTWFYVYRNNTVKSTFANVLRDDYLVEMKYIDRNFYDFDSTPAAAAYEEDESLATTQQPEILLGGKRVQDDEQSEQSEADIDEIIKQKECSKFDQVVDEQQYVDAPRNPEDASLERVQDNETVQPIERADELKKTESLQKLEDLEIMQITKKNPVMKRFQASRSLNDAADAGDVSSALSGNSLMGATKSANNSDSETESKMLLFNGLYFRGRWNTPFQSLRSLDNNNIFYSGDEQQGTEVAMMKSRGDFRMGFSEKLNSNVIELPYQNQRYAMLIVEPAVRENGLKALVSQLDSTDLGELSSNLKLQTVELSLPKFSVETTSSIHKELKQMGLSMLLSEAATLDGVTEEQALRVGELVQHVSVRVDEGSSSENSLSAGSVVRAKAVEAESSTSEAQFVVDTPFMFLVRDIVDDITLVAGLIRKPTGPQLFVDTLTSEKTD